MAEKKEGFEKFKEYAGKFLDKQFKATIIGTVKEKINEFKKAVMKTIAFIIFMVFGISIIFVGVSEYLASVFPILSHGISYILFGMIFIIVALILKPSGKA